MIGFSSLPYLTEDGYRQDGWMQIGLNWECRLFCRGLIVFRNNAKLGKIWLLFLITLYSLCLLGSRYRKGKGVQREDEILLTFSPAARITSWPSSAGFLLPETGASRKQPPFDVTAWEQVKGANMLGIGKAYCSFTYFFSFFWPKSWQT